MVDNFFKNKYAQSLLVFLAVLGIAYIYQSVAIAPESQPAPVVKSTESMETMTEAKDGMDMEIAETEAGEEVDYSGTHIMPNGDVMTGAGIVIDGAIILETGDIAMPDGTVLTPVMDMR